MPFERSVGLRACSVIAVAAFMAASAAGLWCRSTCDSAQPARADESPCHGSTPSNGPALDTPDCHQRQLPAFTIGSAARQIQPLMATMWMDYGAGSALALAHSTSTRVAPDTGPPQARSRSVLRI